MEVINAKVGLATNKANIANNLIYIIHELKYFDILFACY